MVLKGAVKAAAGADDLASAIAQVINRDLAVEEQIEMEARQMLSKNRNLPPPGTGEYQAAFTQAKQAAARRRGFIL